MVTAMTRAADYRWNVVVLPSANGARLDPWQPIGKVIEGILAGIGCPLKTRESEGAPDPMRNSYGSGAIRSVAVPKGQERGGIHLGGSSSIAGHGSSG